jgi:hypothetical protein
MSERRRIGTNSSNEHKCKAAEELQPWRISGHWLTSTFPPAGLVTLDNARLAERA